MYLPMQIPKLSADLVQRLYPLCQRLEIPMAVFVNEAVAQAVARAEEGLERGGEDPRLEGELAKAEAELVPALAAG
ncbi:MAG: hypothetical protein HYW07_06730 [Candidatus Latescibacteria bacterium]|nr:hypothetical protein [Candidatus Latescibacterota bacterium]